jgi:hypothetical protein
MLEAPPMYDDYVSYIRDSNMYMNKLLRILLLKKLQIKESKSPTLNLKIPQPARSSHTYTLGIPTYK